MASATGTVSARKELRGALRELHGSFSANDLLTWAGALAFQIATSIVPFLLFGVGLLGFLSLEDAWNGLAKDIRPDMSQPAFQVVDDTVRRIIGEKQGFWVTGGFALAIWQVSGGIRSIMGGLEGIYEVPDERSWLVRARRSIVLGLIVSALVLAAIAAVMLTPLLYGDLGQPLSALVFVARWGTAAVLLGLATGITMRLAPDRPQPASWVSVGTLIIVGSWILASILFGLYIRYIANYGSVFGNLATVVVLFGYVYLSAVVFFVGAQVDAIIRTRLEGNPQGR